MNRKLLTLIALIVCGTGLYFWWFSDSKVITRNTESLIGCFEKDASDGRFSGAISTSTFRDLLHENIVLKLQRSDIPYASMLSHSMEKGDLVQLLSGLSQSAAIITITDKKISILELEGEQASVNLTFHITTEKLPKNLTGNMDCDLTFKKIEDDWLLSEAVVK